MNRRGFLKTLAGLPALAILKPKALPEVSVPYAHEMSIMPFFTTTVTTTSIITALDPIYIYGGTATKDQFLNG